MEIRLAGYNVEAEILEKKINLDEPLTPEVISASYARISRSSSEIRTLRQKSRQDVQKARNSNKTIIFEMGHHSVAEHAVFNFDIVGVSRLALEEIEKFRLVSYTEKSQRYVTLKGDYILPQEINDEKSKKLFNDTVQLQNTFYKKALEILKEYLFDTNPAKIQSKAGRHEVEGWAKEDARYILSLATQGQVGVTINARNLEHLFRRFTLSQRREVQDIGNSMYNQVEKIAPSLILFPKPSRFETKFTGTFKEVLSEYSSSTHNTTLENIGTDPQILEYTQNADEKILASLIAINNTLDYAESSQIVENMSPGDKKSVFIQLFEEMEFFDSLPREFEIPEFTFQAIISASNFAQLKRHRIATLLSGDYSIELGNTIPENICKNGLEKEFKEILQETNRVYSLLKKDFKNAADYILTNSHRRSVIMKMNLREFYHFVRLRSDQHAQWDIRALSDQLLKKVKKIMPYSALMACGKSNYSEEFEKLFHKKPKLQLDGNKVTTAPLKE